MRLTKTDVRLLQNFTDVNDGVVFENSDTITTMSERRHMAAIAKFSTPFPRECALADLRQFLNMLDIVEDPQLDFEEKFVRIYNQKNQEVKFWYSPLNCIKGYNNNGKLGWPKFKLPSDELKFKIESETLSDIKKAAAGLGQMPHVCVVGKDGELSIVVRDSKNPTSNTWRTVIGKTNYNCNMVFNRNYWNFLPKPYDVTISSKGIAHFVSNDVNDPFAAIEYFVVADAESVFE